MPCNATTPFISLGATISPRRGWDVSVQSPAEPDVMEASETCTMAGSGVLQDLLDPRARPLPSC